MPRRIGLRLIAPVLVMVLLLVMVSAASAEVPYNTFSEFMQDKLNQVTTSVSYAGAIYVYEREAAGHAVPIAGFRAMAHGVLVYMAYEHFVIGPRAIATLKQLGRR
jgi:hypothetical protein